MNPTNDALLNLLTRLQLTARRERLDSLLDEAARRELSLRAALAFLCEAEVARREQPRFEMATRLAKFPFAWTLDGFDIEAQLSLDRQHLRELALCRWVGNGDCLLLLGRPGVGTTHLAIALGHGVKDRRERAGMQWPLPGTQALLNLRGVALNDEWEPFMNHYIQHETARLYANIPIQPPSNRLRLVA